MPLVAYANHATVVATYCKVGSALTINKVEVFDTESGTRIKWWSGYEYDSETSGLEAWMKQDKPETWKKHRTQLYKVLKKECAVNL